MELSDLYRFKDFNVVITGGAGVLGGEIACALLGAGANIAIIDRDTKRAEQLIERLGCPAGCAITVYGDVLIKDTLEKALEVIAIEFGQIHALVNAAGGNHPSATTRPDLSFFDLPLDALRHVGVEKKSKLDPSVFFGMIDNVVEVHPQIKVVATTLREVHSTVHHSWGAVAWIDGQTYVSPTTELHIYDRVGGGDGFASGFFYGLLTGEEPQDAVNLGWAHGALLTTFPGDTTMATVEQVRAFAQGGSARIQR